MRPPTAAAGDAVADQTTVQRQGDRQEAPATHTKAGGRCGPYSGGRERAPKPLYRL